MRAHDPRLVIVITVTVLAIGHVWFAFRHAKSGREIALRALRSGLERAYDRAAAESPFSEAGQAISPEVFQWVLTNKNDILTSFGKPKDILLPRVPVPIPSDHWVCVVRMRGDGLYGIDGRRISRVVAPSELSTWSYTAIITNSPVMR